MRAFSRKITFFTFLEQNLQNRTFGPRSKKNRTHRTRRFLHANANKSALLSPRIVTIFLGHRTP